MKGIASDNLVYLNKPIEGIVAYHASAKVISFWCHLVAFDHACHVSKQ